MVTDDIWRKEYNNYMVRKLVFVKIMVCRAVVKQEDSPKITVLLNMLLPKYIIDPPNYHLAVKPGIGLVFLWNGRLLWVVEKELGAFKMI